jgi:imidazolonepropionase-like amidohydrolase
MKPQQALKKISPCNVDLGYTPAEALKHFTGNAGIVLGGSNIEDPYKRYGKGAIKENYYADVLLWDGDPISRDRRVDRRLSRTREIRYEVKNR